MGISRDKWHKRRKTGGRMCPLRKKRKFELGRPPANTKLYAKRVRTIRVRGGNTKVRALRLDHGNYSWGSEACTHKTRILDVVYNASNNELVRTKTLVKNAIVQIDATPFRHWYEQHYCLPLGRRANTKKGSNKEDDKKDEVPDLNKKSKKTQKKYLERQKHKEVEKALEDQFLTGRILACVASRPGQSGRCDGYILEGKELEFYLRKIKTGKKAK